MTNITGTNTLAGPAVGQLASQMHPHLIPELDVISADDLYHRDIPLLQPMVDGLLFKGLTILAGRPKEGKSWLALQLALGVVSESSFAGLRINEPGRVLYLALEEPKRRTQSRMKLLTSANDFLGDLGFLYTIAPMEQGGLAQLDSYLKANPVKLVIIDTYMGFLQSEGGKRDIVQADYNRINSLRQLAEKHDCAIILVHHTRKAEGSTVDSLLGTTGISAACDCIWQLQKKQDGDAVLKVTGREVEEDSFALRFSKEEGNFGWLFTGGNGAHASVSPQRRQILDLLTTQGPLTPKRMAELLGKNDNTTRRLIQKLSQEGLVEKIGDTYQLAEHCYVA
jgi:archaellum biogenesis ATPase FlaH